MPITFDAVVAEFSDRFSVSERVLDPALRIGNGTLRLAARLGGIRTLRGTQTFIEAPSPRHAWVLDGNTIRPLPQDTPDMVNEILEGADPQDVPFALGVRLTQEPNELILIEADPDVFRSGRAAADELVSAVVIPGLDAKLFPYQARGVQWMWQTARRTGGLILADEMGLGKTLQIIALLMMDPPPQTAPALIVCPTSLIANWVREIRRFAPSLSILVHRGAYRAGIFRDLQVASVVITTYDTMVNDVAVLSSLEWSWLICDEAQAVKNPESNRRQALATIPRRYAIPMTGTPVENTLLDLWSLVDLAVPGMLGERSVFEVEYPDTLEAGQGLAQLTDPVILKRRVADVAGDLPERIDVDLPVLLDDDLARQYELVRQSTLEKYPVAGALVATLQLQLFCAHPWLRSQDDAQDHENAHVVASDAAPLMTPKMERAIALLHEAFINRRKVIVFASYNKIGDLLKRAGSELPAAWWGAINGSTAQEDRQSIVDEFSAFDGPACLVLNPRAAGAGLNITAATIVIHFTPLWNPALEAQASARAYRRGQTEPVTMYRLFYEDTVEQVMIERSAWKNDLANETVPLAIRDDEDLTRALKLTPNGNSP
ncbi:ATP-dependent helicase HepA [Thalassovita autumnalis]|uniref:ATP-dependent helicase HepA n=1 Tax=Thalassovita autumnalis TaxID=2072972 RepID=A0A0P1G936_9RHOB|nr:DEAD/DEAH box helicase [Thalassovita autumnalis]CUH68967.1 ATP-dependent helicase HepA [Thalassovita autumnalis]CUH72208.1 ATP-dependent helicase HepA [Thalassovita autumnalis]